MMGSHSSKSRIVARINLHSRVSFSLQTPLGPALRTTFAIKPTCLAKGPAHPALATRPVECVVTEHQDSGIPRTCILTYYYMHPDRQTHTYACPDTACYTSIEALHISLLPLDCSPCGPHASFRLGRPTYSYIHTYTHPDADSHIPRTGYTRAHTSLAA